MEKNKGKTVGLDIGGANIKAASLLGPARSTPFELWRQPERLPEAIADLLKLWPDCQHVAVTMTGELCDCFETKRVGVQTILQSVENACPGRAIYVWGIDGVWHSVDQARQAPLMVGAGNWHALATYVGRFAPSATALLIDTGSTTTDIIPLRDGVPATIGKTDPDRLRSGELVYTGVRRTPVCALLPEGFAAEWFATSADVYLRLGVIPEDPADCATADGRPSTIQAAHARLARMMGGDSEISSLAETNDLALAVYRRQRALIADGIRKVVQRQANAPNRVIFAGSGEFLARTAWNDYLQHNEQTTISLIEILSITEMFDQERSSAACAHALAVLLEETKFI